MDRWNVSRVTDFSSMFAGAEAYDAGEYGIENWDTAAATDMCLMVRHALCLVVTTLKLGCSVSCFFRSVQFAGATLFNSSIILWNTASVLNMSGMVRSTCIVNVDEPVGPALFSLAHICSLPEQQPSIVLFLAGWCRAWRI
jgi:Mycoplasma protein of unknown function, DUF285